MPERPQDVTEDELKAASEGRSEDILAKRRLRGKTRPFEVTEEEVKAAREGRSESILGPKEK